MTLAGISEEAIAPLEIAQRLAPMPKAHVQVLKLEGDRCASFPHTGTLPPKRLRCRRYTKEGNSCIFITDGRGENVKKCMYNMKPIFQMNDSFLKNLPMELEGFDEKVWGLLRRGPSSNVHTNMYADFFEQWGFEVQRSRARVLDYGR